MTNYFELDESLQCKYPALNQGHQTLLLHINGLLRWVMEKQAGQPVPPPQVFDLLMDLLQYSREHFCAEESIMTRLAYPLLEPHRHQHDAMFEGLVRHTRDFYHQRVDVVVVTLFLLDWWNLHIQEDDRLLSLFLQRNPPPAP
ncbi:MAG: hemerythrin family protein [Deltaproteobacteria bacterium]|nr:hemerythrin family protein [Deltaproteobacteria bacterium]